MNLLSKKPQNIKQNSIVKNGDEQKPQEGENNENNQNATEITFPKTINDIYVRWVYGMNDLTNLERVTIPEGIRIGTDFGDIFTGCPKLNDFIVDANHEKYKAIDK